MTRQEHYELWDKYRIAARDALKELLRTDIHNEALWQEFKKNDRLAWKHNGIAHMMMTKELKRLETKGH